MLRYRSRCRPRVLSALESFADEPRPNGVKKRSGSDLYRTRVGDYRIVYALKDRDLAVLVVKIAHRREAYR
ncbi:MAG: type II toxin-antitoxin system RelE family toxin [Methylococcales bacterium]